MSGKREDCPGEAPRSCQGWSSAFQPLHAALYNRILPSITQGQKRNGRIVRVRCKWGPVDNAITGIPPSTRAYTIHQHLDAAIDAKRNAFQATTRARELV